MTGRRLAPRLLPRNREMIFTPYGLPEMDPAYLGPTYFLDSDTPIVVDFAKKTAGSETDHSRIAVKLFYAVRDEFRYDPFAIWLAPEKFQASIVIRQRYGFCITKAVLLAAAARACGI